MLTDGAGCWIQIDSFVFKTLLMWLQEDSVFTELNAAVATETDDSSGAAATASATVPAATAHTDSTLAAASASATKSRLATRE